MKVAVSARVRATVAWRARPGVWKGSPPHFAKVCTCVPWRQLLGQSFRAAQNETELRLLPRENHQGHPVARGLSERLLVG